MKTKRVESDTYRRRVRSGGSTVLLPLAMIAAFGITSCGGEAADGDAGDVSAEPVDAAAGAGVVLGDACGPVAPGLASDASLSGMSGTYSLTLSTSGTPPAASEGTLRLEPLPEALQEMAGAATPLGGTADIDVEAVGALRLGDLASADPEAPGVLVIEMGGPSIILRFGSEANRRDQVAFDGGYTVLTVHQIGTNGFDGSWRSGTRDGVNEGHFCARRGDG